MRSIVPAAVALMAVAAGCSDDQPTDPVSATAVDAAAERLAEVRDAVLRWQAATTIDGAQSAAEEARNLITGPETFGAGDLDGDGVVMGSVEVGLLPSSDGGPGLATALAGCDAVERDVLGGDWDDPETRWAVLASTIDGWAPANNTYPSLPSHPQRVIGWADNTLSLDQEPHQLEFATEHSGHALLHVDVSERALDDCLVTD